MKKENDISYIDFLDFEVFALPDEKPELFNEKNSANKSILVVYSNEKNDPQLEVLLKNILAAAELDFEKDIIFLKSTTQGKFSFNEIQEKLSVKDILFFGITPSNFGLHYEFEAFQPLVLKQVRILLVDSLEDISSNVNKKKALWSCLKEMYLQKNAE